MKKSDYWNETLKHLMGKMAELELALKDTQDSANSDTKSSAGDKHETSRAMAHIENERLANQLKALQNQVETLQKINPAITSESINFGSLVDCESIVFFLSVGIGNIKTERSSFFAIATDSPLGKSMLGKKVGDTIKIVNNIKTIKNVE